VAKILVADDNSNIQKMVGLALKDQGIDVVAVGNGEAAVRKISDIKPDLVLADVFMPVRNGYEVCRYVKEDTTLAHIPVILLVGAFDPLDEQEAQRVGADGVLKKPFVPPDPLISMVKSALTRAGVPLGPSAPAEKPAVPARSTADILSGHVGAKIAAHPPEKLPEVAPEPLEEFAAPPREQVKIAAGQEPVAFGSLLDTQEEDDASVLSSKPMIELAKSKNWDEETNDVPEEEEEEAPRGGWRATGIDDELERAAKATESVPDWRDQAFHGNSPAKSNGSVPSCAPAHEHSDLVEAAETRSVAVTTIEAKPAESPIPFSGDAWAAAMAAGVEEKLAQQAETVVAEPKAAPVPEAVAAEAAGPVAVTQVSEAEKSEAPAVEEVKAPEPAGWPPVPESSWEAEAKRASMLASTWDAPAPPAPAATEETQEISAYSPEQPEVHAEAHVAEAEPSSAYSAHFEAEPVPVVPGSIPAIDTSAEVAVEAGPSSHWETAWEAAAAAPEAPEPAVESDPEPAAQEPAIEEPVAQEPVAETLHEEATVEPANIAEPAAAPEAHAEPAAQPNMDELVARVLDKMNPDVLQRVTREILKPVIEAIVRDELDSKKS